jgi:pimeloyl-ACP methyl ester carboxylesterase
MLVIAGRDDWSIPLTDHETLARAYGGELVVCPGGHDLMLSVRWAETAEAIRNWLSLQFERRV